MFVVDKSMISWVAHHSAVMRARLIQADVVGWIDGQEKRRYTSIIRVHVRNANCVKQTIASAHQLEF